jgi:hypothetical protein
MFSFPNRSLGTRGRDVPHFFSPTFFNNSTVFAAKRFPSSAYLSRYTASTVSYRSPFFGDLPGRNTPRTFSRELRATFCDKPLIRKHFWLLVYLRCG